MRQSLLRRSVSRNAHLLEALEQRCLLAADMSPWHNVTTPVDVNRDGYVSAIDALLVINEINRNGAVSLSSSGDTGPTSTFYDVNNDYYISAIDALLVINRLNENSRNPQPLPQSVPTADSYTAQQNTPLVVSEATGVLANDRDGTETITAVKLTDPTHGTLTLAPNGGFTYTPAANYFGADSFTYAVNNGGNNSSPVTVSLTVNAPPVAGLDAYQVAAGSTLTVNAADGLLRNDIDPDGGTLTVVLKTPPSKGSFILSDNGSFTYTPASGVSGLDSFTYVASDGTGESSDTIVRINVRSSSSTVEFSLSTVNAAGNAITSIPVGGTFFVQVQVEDVRAVPTGVFQAFLDIFYDARLIDVTGAPTFGSDYPNSRKADITTDGIVNEAGALAGLQELGAGPKVLMRIPVQALATGIAVFAGDPRDLSPANDVLLFAKPTAEPVSAMSFVPVSINVFQGAVPTAVNDNYDAQEDVQLNIAVGQGVLANDTHPGSLPLTANIVQNVQNGTLTLNANGSFSYLANAKFHGVDTFTYTANDGTVNSNTATVTINVASVDDPPTAVNDSYTVGGASITVTAANGVLKNDTDLDGDLLTAQLVSQPANGILTLNADGSFTYTPRATFVGVDTFTYRAVGNGVSSNLATVSLNVDDLTPSSIAGFVYTDVNNDGIRGLTEAPIAGVLITLQGTTASGQSVLRTTTTAGNGSYRFDGVTRGTYSVIEDQPLFMIDGKDTFGGQLSPINDAISFDLPPGTNATGVNFGEWGLLPDFARNGALISRPAVSELLLALDNTGVQDWWCGTPWQQYASVTTQLNSARTILTVTVRNTQGQTFSSDVIVVNNPRVQILGTRPEGLMIRLVGSPGDFGLPLNGLNAVAVDAAFRA